MNRILHYLRYDWPVQFILFLTNWLPDNIIFLKLRGALVAPFIGSCNGKLLVARNVVLQQPAGIHFGRGVYIGYGTCFLTTADIVIGNDVHIAPYCVIVSANHVRVNGSFSNDHLESAPINIMKGSWLGAHVVVTSGSKIAPGSAVGAGAVVRGVFDKPALLGGVPAKVIRYYN